MKHPRYGGRKKGTPNKSTRNIRDAMTESAVKHGIDGKGTGGLTGFCQWLLKNDLKAWCHIFSRLVPLQVAAETTNHHRGVTQVNIVTVPSGDMFTPEQCEALMSGKGFVPDAPLYVESENVAPTLELKALAPPPPPPAPDDDMPMAERLKRFGCVRVV